MREAKISVMGLYDWDNSLFDLLALPAALNKNDLVTNLLAELAELETLYPNPVVMKPLIGAWSRKQLPVWQHLYETTQYQYDPIENYNRYETGSDDGTGSTTHSGTDTRQIDTKTGGADTSTGFAQTDHNVAGFNSSAETLVKQYSDETNSNQNIEYGRTENVSDSLKHGERVTESRNGTHNLHAHGNIGVMSTQDMIKQEREIALFNLYDIIIDEFKQRFCIMVY